MRHLVLGTAGHIDHGKSALVRALSGIDPDRLKEEKLRGITIELGFADMELDDDRVLSFVDVPGHERFVRHMVAGAMGIDAVMLVVAADQGVQPQTREHLDICSLLGVSRGVVALTKCDLVDPDLQEVVALELTELLADTFLAAAPVVPVSAKTETGLEDLRRHLSEMFDAVPPRSAEGIARLPVDRSFVLKGFGTVVTGTLADGQLHEGDEVSILPGAGKARIRGLQVHRHSLEIASAGQRTAVNLQGVDCSDVPRGSTIARPGTLTTTRRAWARLRLLPSAPDRLAGGGPVRFHQGTCDRAARFRVLGSGDDGYLHVELNIKGDTVLAPGDRFILRRPAPVDTVGGGVVVDIRPPVPKAATADCFATAALELPVALQLRLRRAGIGGGDPEELRLELGRPRVELDRAMESLEKDGATVRAGSRWFDRSVWEDVELRALNAVAEHHVERPLQAGIAREALRASVCSALAQDAWREMLESLRGRGDLRLEGEAVARSDHRVILGDEDQALAARIAGRYREAGLEPPDVDDVVSGEDRKRAAPVIAVLLARGELVRVDNKRMFHAEALARLRSLLLEYAAESRTIDVAGFKELAGITRKNAIPLLEYLDGERATRRVGDRREILLREGPG